MGTTKIDTQEPLTVYLVGRATKMHTQKAITMTTYQAGWVPQKLANKSIDHLLGGTSSKNAYKQTSNNYYYLDLPV